MFISKYTGFTFSEEFMKNYNAEIEEDGFDDSMDIIELVHQNNILDSIKKVFDGNPNKESFVETRIDKLIEFDNQKKEIKAYILENEELVLEFTIVSVSTERSIHILFDKGQEIQTLYDAVLLDKDLIWIIG